MAKSFATWNEEEFFLDLEGSTVKQEKDAAELRDATSVFYFLCPSACEQRRQTVTRHTGGGGVRAGKKEGAAGHENIEKIGALHSFN